MTNFISLENKQLLWNLLIDNNAFLGLSEEKLPRVKKEFEATITHIDAMYSNLDLIAKNKHFLKIFVSTLNSIKDDTLVTSQEIRNKKKDDVNQRFSSMKNEFDEMIKINRPEEISFGDTKSDEPIKNMDELLKSTIAQRDLILNDIPPPNTSTPAPLSTNQNTIVDSAVVKPQKSVSFSETITSNDTKLLKEILTNQQIIIDKLNKLDLKRL